MSTMSNDTVFCYRPLLATEQGIYDAFTFPSLRSLLQHAALLHKADCLGW